MRTILQRAILTAICVIALGANGYLAHAQSFPSKSIRIVVPYPPGGGGDTQTRMLAKVLAEDLGQPVVVENRPGGNGLIGTKLVADAPPDGYTLLFTTATQLLVTPLLQKDTEHLREKLTPVSGLSNQPTIIVVPTGSSIRSLRELIDSGKAQDAKVTYGSAGPGSLSNIIGERLNAATGARFVHVPYKGTGQLVTAILAGEVTYTYVVGSAAVAHLRAGNLRPLAVVDSVRSPSVPDVPTVKEATGLDGFTQTAWFGLMAPAETPKPIINLLHQKIAKVMNQPDVREKLIMQSAVSWPVGPKELDAILSSDAPIYAQSVKQMQSSGNIQ